MKIRIKFAKTGSVRFVGHLDFMRFFQKLIRRSEIDIKYSQGFNPHQIMSFAAPLGIGLESLGEYVDIEVNTTLSTKEAVRTLNEHSTEEVRVLDYRLLPDEAKNAMASVAAADYRVTRVVCDNNGTPSDDVDLTEAVKRLMASETVEIERETKKGARRIDIRPWILSCETEDENTVFMKVVTGSSANLKPETVLEACYQLQGKEMPFLSAFRICRLEVYGLKNGSNEETVRTEDLLPLVEFGKEIIWES